MANRTMICPACGFLRRAACESLRAGPSAPSWPRHCERSMLILGYRQSQALTQLTPERRVRWVALGGPISKGQGRKRWRPILSQARLKDRYPLG